MLKQLLIAVLIGLTTMVSAAADDGVRCELKVHLWDETIQSNVLLYVDTADFLKDTNVTGFMVGLSIDVEVTAIDSAAVAMIVHVHTFAPQPSHGARNFQVEYGLPARLGDLVGKNGRPYQLTITPLEAITIDPEQCSFSHHAVEDFHVDPSAHMNIYYVPQTLGDFHWNAIKGMLEEEYSNFSRMTNLNMPGKYLLYLCPCKLGTVIWDDRFGMMIDPVRSTMFGIYAKNYNSIYPFLISQAATYKNYGYAPSFLADGLANYLSFAIHDIKKLKEEGALIPVDSLLSTNAFFQADPRLAEGISATFVHYLIDQYRVGTFLQLYRAADDLNLRDVIVETYGKSLDELEAGWLNYVDTVSLQFGQYGYHAMQAETMLNYDLALEYSRKMMPLATNFRDSLEALRQLTRVGFFKGDYYAAIEDQQAFVGLIDSLSAEWMKLAAYRMMVGEYEVAEADLRQAEQLDSTNSLVQFNLALNRLCQADTVGARELFSAVVEGGGAQGGLIESRIMLAYLLTTSGSEDDQAMAVTHYNAVAGIMTSQDTRHNPSPSQSMWFGIAYLGMGDTGSAEEYLQTALFLETREFYIGMINLWLGKVAAARGEPAVARDYFQRVLAGSSAHYHQEEARRLLEGSHRP